MVRIGGKAMIIISIILYLTLIHLIDFSWNKKKKDEYRRPFLTREVNSVRTTEAFPQNVQTQHVSAMPRVPFLAKIYAAALIF